MKIRLGKNQPKPEYQTQGAAAFDLCATETVTLTGQVHMMNLEIACEIPEGHAGFLICRSSMAKRGIRMANAIGLIDSDYRGFIHAPLTSVSAGGTKVEKGERLVQLIIQKVEQLDLVVVEELDDTDRGSGGFGSTGK